MATKVAAAAGTAGSKTAKDSPDLGKLIEMAMHDAVMQATKEGISVENGKEIIKRKFAARDKVVKAFREAEAKRIQEAK